MIKIFCLFLLSAFFIVPPPVFSDEQSDADSILEDAAAAVSAENWETAVELYNKGKKLFSEDPRFYIELGNLYFNQALYKLSFIEYQTAEKINENDINLLYSLAQTSGLLNLDSESARYYEKILEINPNDFNALGSLAWMYFKLHKLDKGEELLKNAVSYFGKTPDFMMTLATIYSHMYEYEKSREAYQWTIDMAERFNLRAQASLSHYNFSILESKFYNYQNAFDETEKSIYWQNRSSPYLARGELYLRKLQFNEAVRDYETALETDPSALSKISLALTKQLQGKLDESFLLAKEAMYSKDLSWMLNYGINVAQYKRDIYEILYKTSKGLYQKSRRAVYSGISEIIKNKINTVKYKFNSIIYRYLFEMYTVKYAKGFEADLKENRAENIELFGQFYNAFEKYSKRALSYLFAAKNIETVFVPRSTWSWLRAEGELKKDALLIEEALGNFDEVWEADEIARCYESLYKIYKRNGNQKKAEDCIEKLFLINRGALLQNNIPLICALEFNVSGADNKKNKKLLRLVKPMLKKAGFIIREKSRFTLSVYIDENNSSAEIYENAGGKTAARKTFAASPLDKHGAAWLVRTISEMAFTRD